MSRNTSIILGEHFDKFIQEEINSGRYSSASEIIRNGLRLLEIQKKKIDAINDALITGEESGKPVEFNNDLFKSRMKKKFELDA
jgi:antitoxin ParD1/3/4